MPMRGELPTITTRIHTRASQFKTVWSRLAAVLFDPELQTVVAFSMIAHFGLNYWIGALLAILIALPWWGDAGQMRLVGEMAP